jgi:hypothetical protein
MHTSRSAGIPTWNRGCKNYARNVILREPATEESPLFLAKIGDYSLPELALSLPKWSLTALCVSAGQGVPLARMTNSISPRLSVVLPGLQTNEKKVAFCCRIKGSDFI